MMHQVHVLQLLAEVLLHLFCTAHLSFMPETAFSYLVVLQLLQFQLLMMHPVHTLQLLRQVLLLLLQSLYLCRTRTNHCGRTQRKYPLRQNLTH